MRTEQVDAKPLSPNLIRDVGLGIGAGLLLQNPALGALGGLAFSLLSTPGMADGMKRAASDAFRGLAGDGGVQSAVDALGRGLFGAEARDKTRADPEAAAEGARAAEKKSGLPGWAKWLGLGGGALMLFNNLFDNFSLGGFGAPLYGGFGMHPFMDPMTAMMGMPGGLPAPHLLGGMGLVDLLIAGGVGIGAWQLMKR